MLYRTKTNLTKKILKFNSETLVQKGMQIKIPLIKNGQRSTVAELQLNDRIDLHLRQEEKTAYKKKKQQQLCLTFPSLRVDDVNCGIQGTSPDLILSNCQQATLRKIQQKEVIHPVVQGEGVESIEERGDIVQANFISKLGLKEETMAVRLFYSSNLTNTGHITEYQDSSHSF